jgi:hypothetical protein
MHKRTPASFVEDLPREVFFLYPSGYNFSKNSF